MLKYTFLAAVLSLAVACKKEPTSKDYSKCTFSHNPAATTVKWTAYKFTDRLGVPGTFNEVLIKDVRTGNSPENVYAGSSFEIEGKSVNTKNPERDAKISQHFFGALKDEGRIRGKIVSVASGHATVLLRMNGVEREVAANVSLSNGLTLQMDTTIDLGDFAATSALGALNRVCTDLHKGKDGKSKLWPDIKVEIQTTVTPTCPG